MRERALSALRLVAGGLFVAFVMYAIALAANVLEQLYPCRVTDPDNGASHAVSCLYQPTKSGEAP